MKNNQQFQYPFFRRLVTTPSLEYLLKMVSVARKEIIIVSPWIKRSTLQKIIDTTKTDENIRWKVLTRGNHDDFCVGSSDIDAFKLMIENSSFDIRVIKQLHAKVYIVDDKLSLVTSANLTVSGMEINQEVGIASQDPIEISELIKELSKWFSEAIRLDQSWLEEEQKILSTYKKDEPVAVPFDLTKYHHLEQGDKRIAGGKFRELHLPEVWKPLLDSLKETEIPTHIDCLVVNDLIPAFVRFFKYVEAIQGGKRLLKFLVNWLVHNQTLETIGDDKITRERVSQIIGKRNNSENVWKSEEGEKFTRQISLFLKDAIETTELRVSDVLSTTQLQPLGLSQLDLCQFACGMIKKKIIVGNFHADITPTNQFLICDKEIYSILKELDHIFCADYREFMDLEKFCRLGEMTEVAVAWFYPNFKIFKNLYLTINGKVGCRNWSIEKLIEALAWELADHLDYYYWHYSEMREAIYYLFPARFGKINVRHVNARLSNSPDIFQFAGSKGYWQLTSLGDGYHNNKEAIAHIFRTADTSLHYKEVIRDLEVMGRRVNEGSIYALLDRDQSFEHLGQGKFRLMENVD